MMHKLRVQEHLRNGALYLPVSEPPLSGEWKRRLFRQRLLRQQLLAALEERPRLSKRLLRIGVPVLCGAFAFAAYLGLIYPAGWSEALVAYVSNLDAPPVGLKESLLYIAAVNGLTILVRKRAHLFG